MIIVPVLLLLPTWFCRAWNLLANHGLGVVRLANFAYSKREVYYIWTKAMVTKDLKVKASEV